VIGWRKLTAWGLVFLLVLVATILQLDVPPHAKELLVFVTGGFFLGNAAGKFAQAKGSGEPS
jgi:hypothetical protein